MCSPIWYGSVSSSMGAMMLATFVFSAFRLQLAASLPVLRSSSPGHRDGAQIIGMSVKTKSKQMLHTWNFSLYSIDEGILKAKLIHWNHLITDDSQ